MREVELNAIFNIIAEPEKNVVNIKDRKLRQEVERIVRIFNITNEQRKASKSLGFRCVATFDMVQSYN